METGTHTSDTIWLKILFSTIEWRIKIGLVFIITALYLNTVHYKYHNY